MSESVSSMDVEDVLSSIRRLVSEEAKGAPGASAPQTAAAGQEARAPRSDPPHKGGPEAAVPPPSNDFMDESGEDHGSGGARMSFRHQAAQARVAEEQKLVLTADFRVSEPEQVDADAIADGDAFADAGADSNADTAPFADAGADSNADTAPFADAGADSNADTAPFADAAPGAGAGADAFASADAPDEVEPAPPEAPEPRRYAHLRPVADERPGPARPPAGDQVRSAAPETEDGLDADETALESGTADSLFERAKMAMQAAKEVESPRPAYVFGLEDEPAPRDGAPAPEAPETAAPETAAPETAAPAPGMDTGAPAANHDDDGPQGAGAAPVTFAPRHESDGVSRDAFTGLRADEDAPVQSAWSAPDRTTGEAADTDSAAPEAEPQAEPADDGEAATVDFLEEEESILDEDTLRDMISEMVRSELQGELGDRITRNVRKLVRREIQRTLASREFE